MLDSNLESLINAYKCISTSTIGHILDYGHIPYIFPMTREKQIVGIVKTVNIRSKNASKLRDVLLHSNKNDVLFIDARYDPLRSCWGEQRSVAAIHCGLSGIVVLGAVTDSKALLNLKLPIFAQNISCLTTRNDGESLIDIDNGIAVNNFLVETGDLLVADEDGVFVLKMEDAYKYLEEFQKLEFTEQTQREEFFSKNDALKYFFSENHS